MSEITVDPAISAGLVLFEKHLEYRKTKKAAQIAHGLKYLGVLRGAVYREGLIDDEPISVFGRRYDGVISNKVRQTAVRMVVSKQVSPVIGLEPKLTIDDYWFNLSDKGIIIKSTVAYPKSQEEQIKDKNERIQNARDHLELLGMGITPYVRTLPKDIWQPEEGVGPIVTRRDEVVGFTTNNAYELTVCSELAPNRLVDLAHYDTMLKTISLACGMQQPSVRDWIDAQYQNGNYTY